MATALKTDRLSIRVDDGRKRLFAEAAALRGQSVTDFALGAMESAAAMILADQRHFVLSEDDMAEFHRRLEAPVRDLPTLRRLLTEPSVLER